MIKRIFVVLFLSLIALIFTAHPALALEQKNINIVNPIRGTDFWDHPYSILETPTNQYQVIKQNNLPATWLIRYDALKDSKVVDFTKSLDATQEIGLFLEITPTLTTDAGVKYNQSPNWHYAKSVLVIGYSPADRVKLIDTAMKEYKAIYGKYPKSVGAWWIDANSLTYLKDKYGVETNLDVTDQFSTDQYQVWGQYWSSPFYPSKSNALMPAQSVDQKVGVVTIQWATRDPYNAYGSGVYDSTYSVQANDYLLHQLTTDYFKKLVDIYPHLVVGLENDFSWATYGTEFTNQINLLANLKTQGQLQASTMAQFASLYKSQNPQLSPPVLITGTDPLGGSGQVVWFQNPTYRVGWFYGSYGSVIRDLRLFTPSVEEGCLKAACEKLNLAYNANQAIDEVNFNTKWLIDDGTISDVSVKQTTSGVVISYKNQAGNLRTISLLPNDIQVDNNISPVSVAILKSVEEANSKSERVPESQFNSQLLISNLSSLSWGGLKFIIFTILFFFLPGFLLSKRLLVSIPLGWVVFTLFAYIFGLLKIDLAIWVLPVVSLVLLVKSNSYSNLKTVALSKRQIPILITVILGSASLLLTTIKSGLSFNYGLGFWGPNGHDGIWHLALINTLKQGIPPQNPDFAGISLQNYHYFFDLLIAQVSKLFSISEIDLLFRFFPVFIVIFLGLLSYALVKLLLTKYFVVSDFAKELAATFATFLVYFGGNWGWVLSLIRDKSLGGESTFWSQQSVSTLLNPPYAISLVIMLTFLYLFYQWVDLEKTSLPNIFQKSFWQTNWRMIVVLSLLLGSVIEFKVYAGVLLIGALIILCLEQIILKRNWRLVPLGVLSAIITAAVFLPNNLQSGSLLEFSPLWLVISMITSTDRLGWIRLALALDSGNTFKVVVSSLIGIFIFLFGNLGMRVFALFSLKAFWRLRLLTYIALLGTVIPMLFIQKGNGWNIVQFFYYSLFIFDLLAAFWIAAIATKLNKKVSLALVTVLMLVTLPTTYATLIQYSPKRPPASLPTAEFTALQFLSTQPSGVVMSPNFDPKIKDKFAEPLPLLAYDTTSYVTAFSSQPSFMADTINLDIIGVDYKGRVNTQRDALKDRDRSQKLFKDNNISYLYLPKIYNLQIDESRMGLKKIYENESVNIYQVI